MSAATPRRRAGIPLSVKLILTAAVTVAAAVFAAGWFGTRAIEDLARGDAATRRAEGDAAIEREASLLSQKVAAVMSFPVATEQLGDIEALVADTIAAHDRIRWLLVADVTGQIIGATDPTRVGKPLDDELVAEVTSAEPGAVARRGRGTEWTYGTAIRSGRDYKGQIRLGVSTADLERQLAASIAAATARSARERDRLAVLALGLLVAGVAVAALQGVRMARPIKQLAAQADRIAGGDLDQRVPETRHDEIGVLARNFNHMASRIGELLVEQAAKASLEHEMSLARAVQQSMLPAPVPFTHGPVRVLGHCVPASECGGDWWSFRRLSGDRTLIVIGDATGHGVHSAMIAACARGAVEALADTDERLLTPDGVLKAIHSAISGVGDHALLMTCFCAVIDPATGPGAGQIHYANAGQNFPYVMRRGAEGSLDSAQIIAASGNPLGDPRLTQNVRRGSVALRPGDVLVVFTDGVVERQSPTGKLFGDRRLRTVLHGQRAVSERELLALRQRVVDAVDEFAEGTVAADDLTLVLVQYDPDIARDQVRTAS